MAAISFDPNVDYQAKINALKAINPNDPQISTLEQQRIAKGASDPLKYGKYFSDTTPIYSYMAQNAVEPAFNAEQLATEQRFDRLRQAQEAQKSTIDPTYDQYVDRTVEQYQKNKDMVNNETLNRGMGRSSYVVDKLTEVGNEEARAVSDINAQRATAIRNINANITSLDEQLAESLAQMDMDKASQIAAEIDNLRRYYNEMQTTQANNERTFKLQEAGVTGYYNGTPTLDREQYTTNAEIARTNAAKKSGGGGGKNPNDPITTTDPIYKNANAILSRGDTDATKYSAIEYLVQYAEDDTIDQYIALLGLQAEWNNYVLYGGAPPKQPDRSSAAREARDVGVRKSYSERNPIN